MSNTETNQIISLLPAILRKVTSVLGRQNADIEDIGNDVIIMLLAQGTERFDTETDLKRFALRSAKNAALFYVRLHRNSKHGGSVNHTDKHLSKDDINDQHEGMTLAGNGLDNHERDMELQALRNAMSACLKTDEATFIGLVLAGNTAKEAASAVGWSQSSATRRQPVIVQTLRDFMEEME